MASRICDWNQVQFVNFAQGILDDLSEVVFDGLSNLKWLWVFLQKRSSIIPQTYLQPAFCFFDSLITNSILKNWFYIYLTFTVWLGSSTSICVEYDTFENLLKILFNCATNCKRSYLTNNEKIMIFFTKSWNEESAFLRAINLQFLYLFMDGFSNKKTGFLASKTNDSAASMLFCNKSWN